MSEWHNKLNVPEGTTSGGSMINAARKYVNENQIRTTVWTVERVRNEFLKFYHNLGSSAHNVVNSSSVLPKNDSR